MYYKFNEMLSNFYGFFVMTTYKQPSPWNEKKFETTIDECYTPRYQSVFGEISVQSVDMVLRESKLDG